MSKEEIIAAIQQCAAQLGHAPSFPELERTTRLRKRVIHRHFSNYREALRASGMDRQGAGYKNETATLFLDWAATARQLGKVPTMVEYNLHGNYSVSPLVRRFGGWSNVPVAMLEHARKSGLEGEWEDVVNIISGQLESGTGAGRSTRPATGTSLRPRLLPDQPTYGTPLYHTALCMAPTNELGVVFLFGTVAREMGFMVMRLQTEFPDCAALREVEPGRWQWVRIEFEYESRNFLAHQHSVKDCDLIVCWSHNWKDCPLEVIELKGVIGKNLTADERG